MKEGLVGVPLTGKPSNTQSKLKAGSRRDPQQKKLPYEGSQDDEQTTFKNRTLRFTNNNFLATQQAALTSASGFNGVKVDGGYWGEQSQSNFQGNIMN